MWSLIATLLPLILKNLPLLVGIFSGLSNSVKKLPIDPEEVAQLVEEIMEQEVTKVITANRKRIEEYAASRMKDEDMQVSKEINEELDRLEEVLKQQAKEYEEYKNKKKKTNPGSQELQG